MEITFQGAALRTQRDLAPVQRKIIAIQPEKSVPFDKYWRRKRLVFSFLVARGSAAHRSRTFTFVAFFPADPTTRQPQQGESRRLRLIDSFSSAARPIDRFAAPCRESFKARRTGVLRPEAQIES